MQKVATLSEEAAALAQLLLKVCLYEGDSLIRSEHNADLIEQVIEALDHLIIIIVPDEDDE